MTLPERFVTCGGCGRQIQVQPGLQAGTVERCDRCPPAEEVADAPSLSAQLEDLRIHVLGCERRDRLQDRFDLGDRLYPDHHDDSNPGER